MIQVKTHYYVAAGAAVDAFAPAEACPNHNPSQSYFASAFLPQQLKNRPMYEGRFW